MDDVLTMRWIFLAFSFFFCITLGKHVGVPKKGTSLQNQRGLLLALNAGRPFLSNPRKSRHLVQMREDSLLTEADMEVLRGRITKIQQRSALLPTPEKYVAEVSAGSSEDRLFRFANERPEAVECMHEAVMQYLGCLPDERSIFSTTNGTMAELLMALLRAGYMFRNAEYLKNIASLLSSTTVSVTDLGQKFDEIDTDKSGYIENYEVRSLLKTVLHGTPACTEDTIDMNVGVFLHLVDANRDGRVSRQEFFDALGSYYTPVLPQAPIQEATPRTEVSGTLTVAVGDDKVQMDANLYLQSLQDKVESLQVQVNDMQRQIIKLESMTPERTLETFVSAMSEAAYETLTSKMTSEVLDAMRQLINSRLNGEQIQADGKVEYDYNDLRAMFLEFLVHGYRLREREADELHKQQSD